MNIARIKGFIKKTIDNAIYNDAMNDHIAYMIIKESYNRTNVDFLTKEVISELNSNPSKEIKTPKKKKKIDIIIEEEL